MGITINDELLISEELRVTGAYASFKDQPITIMRKPASCDSNSNSSWFAVSTYSIWTNKDEAEQGLSFLRQQFLETGIDLSQPIFPVVYAAIKAQYTSTSDC